MSDIKPSDATTPGSRAEDIEDLFENAPCGYLSIEPAGAIVRANATFLQWTGFKSDEVTGRKFQEFLNIAGRIFYETHFAPLLRMQGFFNEVALDLVGKNGKSLPALVNAVERRSETGELLFIRITIFNATDRRRYERELLEARKASEAANEQLRELNSTLEARVAEELVKLTKTEETLRQSQKMEAIGQLTGGVAHDFNNLLTIIMGGLETIGRRVDVMPESPAVAQIRRSREMSMHGVKRAVTLTARLLAFSRRQTLDPKSLDINRLIIETAELLRHSIGEAISLEAVQTGGLWRAFADAAELENALVNLAVNARDAMPQGGKLTIETANASLDEAYVAGLTEPVSPGQYVLIAVSDTGHGMSEETANRVFEPFFTTKETGKGTGLGLSQVYGFVRQTGGHVKIYSELGVGTTVKLYLPRANDAAQISNVDEVTQPSTDGGLETILVVEDDPELRKYSCGALRELSYRVLEASSGPEALRIIEKNSQIDLLFTDIVMPNGMNGRQLADKARHYIPQLKVLFTTGYTANAIVHQGRLDAGVNLISKPFTFDDLAAKVRAILDRH